MILIDKSEENGCFSKELNDLNDLNVQKGFWIYPAAITIMERTFTTSIYKRIIDVENRNRSPIKLPYENYYKKMESDGDYRFCEFEILNIHESMSSYHVRKCFGLITKWSTGNSESPILTSLIEYSIRTPIVLPDGQLLRKHQGVAYGSEFSLIVTSLMSSFLAVYCMLNQGIEIDVDHLSVCVIGSSITIRVPPSFQVLQMIKDIESLGFSVDSSNIRVHIGGFNWERANIDDSTPQSP